MDTDLVIKKMRRERRLYNAGAIILCAFWVLGMAWSLWEFHQVITRPF